MMIRAGWRAAACLSWTVWVAGGCAGIRPEPEAPPAAAASTDGAVTLAPSTPPATAAATEPATDAADETAAEPATEAPGSALDAGGSQASAEARRTSWRASEEERQKLLEVGPCRIAPPEGETTLDKTRRRLYQTVCGAALWFDGLFGEQRHVAAAQRASGRVELSFTESEYFGFQERTRFNVRVRLPNLEERFEAFVGRDDEEDFVRDRNEGFALRSQFSDLERDDRWVLGLGYGVPGSYAKRTDFRVGAKGGRSPEIFLQGRHRRNWFVGERSLWHFRETAFWTNRDGFGTTTTLDFDRVLTPKLLLRLGGVGTFSEVTEGVDYRAVAVFYQNLSESGRAMAYELFARGETDQQVQLREYGLQTVFRRPLGGRDWLFGEVVAGYSWVREEPADDRQGSYLVGFGVELLYGRDNRYTR